MKQPVIKSFCGCFTGQFFQKGVGDPIPFTVSLIPFFRGFISKACFFCMLLQYISKKRPPGRRRYN
jgi:hypothetical protein